MEVPDKLSTSAGRVSGTTAFQFGIPRITPIMSSMVCSTRSDGAKCCCGNRAVMVRSSLGDFLFSRVWKTPPHRLRMRTLSLSSVPSSSVMNYSLLAFRPPTPPCPLNACRNPAGRCRRVVSLFQQGTLQSKHVILRQSPFADSHTPSSESSPRFCLED